MDTHISPNLNETKKHFDSALNEGKNIFMVCDCKVDYEGRASSTIGWGERMVILKEDSTLMVHSKDKRKPTNWNPSPSVTNTELADKVMKIENTRVSKDEKITIWLKNVYLMTSFMLSDTEELQLKETEEDLKQYIKSNPSSIDDNLKIIEEEKGTPFGDIDLFGKMKDDGNLVVLELKRRKGGLNDVSQLDRYVRCIERREGEEVIGILVAPGITDSAENLVELYGFKFQKMTPKGKG